MTELNNKLADILEVDSVNDSDILMDFDGWDSLTSLSIIAMIDANYNVNISAEDLVSLSSIGDLKKHIQSKAK